MSEGDLEPEVLSYRAFRERQTLREWRQRQRADARTEADERIDIDVRPGRRWIRRLVEHIDRTV
jgi:hypothetical protein